MIALYSPDYEASDHCQAEWAAAYAADPGGERHRLFPFLLKPTELNPLARQIVYTNLVGLSAEDRRAAVLRALDYRPGRRSSEELKGILKHATTPIPIGKAEGGKTRIDVTANPDLDTPLSSDDLKEMPGLQCALADAIIEVLPGNAPKVFRSCLVHYRTHLGERGTRPYTDFLRSFFGPLQKEFDHADFEMWGAGLDDLIRRFFAKHFLLITHFPLPEARERAMAEAPIDEEKAVGKGLTEPIEKVVDALNELSDSDMTTPAFDRVVQQIREEAADLSSVVPTQADSGKPSTIVTPKRRFVLGTIGFLERVYAFIGATASIATTPQGQAALLALRDAIEKLLALVL
ncbi:MAG: hypothetical protein IPL47_12145 [Phyllobacteriaceae bacterium]|nr:hypothetical protein [Phyllobacteriaceae bacterium]